MVNQSFFDDVSNGALQERGVIVMGADEGMLKSFSSDESKLNVTFSSTIINLHYKFSYNGTSAIVAIMVLK